MSFRIDLSVLVVVSFLSTSGSPSQGQSATTDTWQSEARERLEGLYNRGDFRARSLDPQWKEDSSGYRIQERDPRTQKRVTAFYDVATGERMNVDPVKPTNPRRSPDGSLILETGGSKLRLRSVASSKRTTLLEPQPDRDLHFGNVHWHPSGAHVAFVQRDRTDVRFRTMLVPSDPSYPQTRDTRFARVGETIEGLRVGIASVEDANVTWISLETKPEGFYLGHVGWVPHRNELLIESLSRFRDQREFWLATVDGKAKRIYREVNEAWAVGSHQLNTGVHWIRDGDAFIFLSEQDGWRQAFVSDLEGEIQAKLTPGQYDIIDRAFIDEAGGWYYFFASPKEAARKYLHRVPLDGSGDLERISPDEQSGTHDYVFSPDGRWAVHTVSTLNDPPIVDLVEIPNHQVVRTLEENPSLRKRFADRVVHPTEFTTIDLGDGLEMDACITKPNDFDASKKYPVLVYVYGEPYLQTVLDRWGAAQTDFHRVVANTGYVVVSIDNRGTACPKGAAWRRSVFGSLGPLSTDDQAKALQQLAEDKPYIDLSRVAIWGWSGGGSNTLNALFRKPDVYHVGIAVVPKPQPHLYNAWFQEIYMRTPEVNPEGYQRSAPINFAEGLEGKLLIMTGSGETNTHIQIIEGLVDRLIELGKPFDYMVYPNRDHGLSEGRGTRVHVRMKILRYLIEHLPRGAR